MTFKCFLPGNLNLGSLCMKIINSFVVVGLYYGFLTTISVGPSYLFLLQTRVMEKEEGTEKEVSATTGFIMGQLLMFISTYYAPLHLALNRPHTITVLILPYLLFHFFWNEEKQFFDYTDRNSIRNLTIQCVFLNNLIFQLLNQFLLPSSTLVRLVNVYMFRCNNKMLFVTSSFVGWLIGHIFFMKWVGLVLFWIRKIKSIRSNKYILFCKYHMYYLIKSKDQIFVMIFLITSMYYLGRIPSLTFTRGVVASIKTKEAFSWRRNEYRKFPLLWFEEPIVTILFDYKQWNRPLRYIRRNDGLRGAVMNETSQYFFRVFPSYGKGQISFTYPPSLLTFWNMLKRKLESISTWQKKKQGWDPFNRFDYSNKKKKNHLFAELRERVITLDRGAPALDVLQKRIRVSKGETETWQKYLPKANDPFLSGPERKIVEFGDEDKVFVFKPDKPTALPLERTLALYKTLVFDFPSIGDGRNPERNKEVFRRMAVDRTDLEESKDLQNVWNTTVIKINRSTIRVPRWTHNLHTDFQEAETENAEDPTEDYAVLLRTYKRTLIYIDTESKEDQNTDTSIRDTINKTSVNTEGEPEREEQDREIALLNYPKETDSFRGLIRGSMGAQRRKTAILSLYELHMHSPLFLDRTSGFFSLFFGIYRRMENIFSIFVRKGLKLEVSTSDSEEQKVEYKKGEPGKGEFLSRREKEDQEVETFIEDAQGMFDSMLQIGFWDVVLLTQGSRTFILLFQSIFRKNILLPSIVIAKNLVRMLFLQTPEWSADWRDWEKETHIYCTYTGVQISDTEFPKNWLMDGIQIKVLFPFHPKPWRRSKLRSRHRDPMKEKKRNADQGKKKKKKTKKSFYLTVWGGGTEKPFGDPQETPSFFKPILKELKKRIRKEKKKPFLAQKRSLLALLKKVPFLQEMLEILKEKIGGIQKMPFFIIIKEKIKEFPRENPILLFRFGLRKVHELGLRKVYELGLRKVYEPHENREDSILSKKIKEKSIIRMRSVVCTNSSLIENKMKDFANRTTIIREKIETITKEKRKIFLTPDRNISSPNETGCDDKRSESRKRIWQILRRKSVRLIRKLRYFIKSFIERIYMDIFLCTINISRIHAQPFFESKINKYIESIEKKKEGVDEINQDTIDFISTLKQSLSNSSDISNEKSQISWDLSSLSQAYVLYNISQTQVINKYHLRSVLQDRGAHLFLKEGIKDYLRALGILGVKSSPKRLPNSEMDKYKWKNWLRGLYQYPISPTKWSRLAPQKWRSKVRNYYTSQKKESKKDSYEKDQPIHYEKEKNDVMNSLPIQKQKEKFQKNYRYDLLAHKYIHYEDKKDPYSYISISDYLKEDSDFIKEDSDCIRKYVDYLISDSDFLEELGDYLEENFDYIDDLSDYLEKAYSLEKDSDSMEEYSDCLKEEEDRYFQKLKKINNTVTVKVKEDGDYLEYIERDSLFDPDRGKAIGWRIRTRVKKRRDINIKPRTNQKRNSSNLKRNSSNLKSFFGWMGRILDWMMVMGMNEDWMGMNEKMPYTTFIRKRNIPKRKIPEPEPNIPEPNIPKPKKEVLEEKTKTWFFSELVRPYSTYYSTYKSNPWLKTIRELFITLSMVEEEEKESINKEEKNPKLSNQKKNPKLSNSNQKENPKLSNQKEKKQSSQKNLGSDPQKQEKSIKEDYTESDMKDGGKQKSKRGIIQAELHLFLRKYLVSQLNFNPTLNIAVSRGIKAYCFLLKMMKDPKDLVIYSTRLNEIHPDIMEQIDQSMTPALKVRKLVKRGIITVDPIRFFRQSHERFILYQILGFSVVNKTKHQTDTDKTKHETEVNKTKHETDTDKNKHETDTDKNKRQTDTDQSCPEKGYDLLVIDNIPSTRRRRELRIRACFDALNGVEKFKDRNAVLVNDNNIRDDVHFLDEDKHIDTDIDPDIEKLIQLKLFLWPYYRLEDLACMNRYWFDTNNGSRFSMLRIHMYPRFRKN